ncbi:MAG TPA: hypothetical protein VIM05_05625 [Gaiellaceae bacterium]|jgi:hypothetical protein
MKARRRFNQWLALGLGLAALTASGAQAAKGPGAATVQVTATAVRPIEHPGPLAVDTVDTDVVSRYLVNHPAAVRPIEHPGPAAVDTDVVSRYLVNHPAAVPAPHEGGSSWDAVGLAAGSGLGALAIALAGFTLVHRRRSATAALQS